MVKKNRSREKSIDVMHCFPAKHYALNVFIKVIAYVCMLNCSVVSKVSISRIYLGKDFRTICREELPQMEEDMYDKYLQSEIILYCLKKCINGPHLSSAVKVKVLSLLYETSDSSKDNTLRSNATIGKTTFKSESVTLGQERKPGLNLLGIDDDLLHESSEMLTAEQQGQLKDCVLDELSKFHKFCIALNSKVKVPSFEGNLNDFFDELDEKIVNQSSLIENFIDLQSNLRGVEVESDKTVNEIIDTLVNNSLSTKDSGRKLLEDIDKEITDGNMQYYLEKAERILEEKISKDKQKIEQLKLELMGLNIKP